MIVLKCSICEAQVRRKIRRKYAVCISCQRISAEQKRKGTRSSYLKSYRKANKDSWKKASKKAIKKYIKTPKGRAKRAAYEAGRRAALQKALPLWADIDKIAKVYDNRPEGYHVDHIIPLKGKIVSGLHVHNNLQYLKEAENKKKGNRFRGG